MRSKISTALAVLCLVLFSSSVVALRAAEPAASPKPHDFAKWEKAVAAFEEKDKTNPPPKGAVLFVGSSTIVRWKTLAQDFPEFQVINRGFGGNEIVDSTHFAVRIIFPYEPKTICLRAGGNDLWAGKSPEQVFQDFKDFVGKVHEKLPNTKIVFISLSPSIARWKQADKEKATNALIEAYVKTVPNVKFVDTWSVPLGPEGKPRAEVFVDDKLHFNAEGYKLLVAAVHPQLLKD
jgi:hypothetical protein